MSLIEFIDNNLTLAQGNFIAGIMLGILWLIIYDFYHLLFSAILSWFEKKK